MIKAGDIVSYTPAGGETSDAKVSVVWTDGTNGPAADLVVESGELVCSVIHASKAAGDQSRWDEKV